MKFRATNTPTSPTCPMKVWSMPMCGVFVAFKRRLPLKRDTGKIYRMNFTWTSLFQWRLQTLHTWAYFTFHWKREVHVKFIQYILPVSLFNGRRRLKATNTPHMKYAHVWSVCSLQTFPLKRDTGRIYITSQLSLEERSSREVHSVYPTCISLQWKATFEGFTLSKERSSLSLDCL